jgi:hypothetical protein
MLRTSLSTDLSRKPELRYFLPSTAQLALWEDGAMLKIAQFPAEDCSIPNLAQSCADGGSAGMTIGAFDHQLERKPWESMVRMTPVTGGPYPDGRGNVGSKLKCPLFVASEMSGLKVVPSPFGWG